MDDRLEKALQFANYRTTLYQQRESLKLRMANMLVYAHNGGLFRITPELISLVDILCRRDEKGVVLDSNENPIMIEDLHHFLDEIMARYNEVMNEYHLLYENLKKARNVQKVVDW